MTEEEASVALSALLDDLGIKEGETIFLGIDMARLPLPRWPTPLSRDAIRAREDRWCAFVFDHIMNILGGDGTLLVGTFSYSCGNPAIPFDYGATPSEIGPFTDWFRRRPDAIRSLHPIFSVAAVGAKAEELVQNTGAAAFGPCSPFGRLAAQKARFVNLGIPFSQSLTYIHHLEQCYGCNHRYHKVLSGHVYQNGQQIERDFLGYMRWRGVDAAVDVGPLENALKQAGALIEVNRSSLFGQSALVADVDMVGYAMLTEDPWAFSTRKVRIELDDAAVAAELCCEPFTTFKLSR